MIVNNRAWVAAAIVVALTGTACSSTTSGNPNGTGGGTSPVRVSSPADSTTPGAPSAPSSSTASTSSPSAGTNRPFRCTPGFVTTLHGYPVAALVKHYPVPDLTPEPFDLAGQKGVQGLRQGELDVVYTARSTGLPQGPTTAMYRCFVRHAAVHGWQPDRHMNKLDQKDRKPNDPLSFWFFDSGSRFKGGNELSVTYFTSKQAFGQGNQLEVGIRPNGYLPELPPPP